MDTAFLFLFNILWFLTFLRYHRQIQDKQNSKKSQSDMYCSEFFQIFHNKIKPELLTAIFKNTKKENSHEKNNRLFGPVILRIQR